MIQLEGKAGVGEGVGRGTEPEFLDLELQHAADPAVAVRLQSAVVGQVQIQIEVARVKGRAPAADVQQGVDQGEERVGAASHAGGAGEAKCGRGPPAVAPALGENARAHRVLRRQEREDVVEDALREVADSVSPTRHGRCSAGLGQSLRRAGQVRRAAAERWTKKTEINTVAGPSSPSRPYVRYISF